MELVELEEMTDEQWQEIGGEEPGSWGGGPTEAWKWRLKDRHLAAVDPDGRLLGLAEMATIRVAVEGDSEFDVVGVGGVFVRAAERGKGLMRTLVDELLLRARELGPERAMLFCRPWKVAVYESFGFAEIPDTVWVEQPAGRVEIPLPAMWLALHGRPSWPSGRVDVQGLPF